jgi:hypothetical protein
MPRTVLGVAASFLVLAGCTNSSDYEAEKTWRCLADKGLSASLERSPDMMKGVAASITFQRLATKPNEPVASGGFAFVRKGTRPADVKERFLRNRRETIGGRPFAPGYAYGKTDRNVIPWWSDTADATFKSSAESCLER